MAVAAVREFTYSDIIGNLGDGFSIGFEIIPNEILIELNSTNHNFNYGSDLNPLVVQKLGSWDNKAPVRIVVKEGVQLVSTVSLDALMRFSGGWAGRTVIIENYGQLLGRGGNGGSHSSPNSNAGKDCIVNENNCVNLTIRNHALMGGGGGGGGLGSFTSTATYGGGGGAPFGGGGSGASFSGSSASYNAAGNGYYATSQFRSGDGGHYGAAGSAGSGTSGPKGAGDAGGAVSRGQAAWEVLGDVRGSRV